MTGYDANRGAIEDPSIGTLKPYYKSWGIKNKFETDFEEIPTRRCTDAELHLDGDTDPESKFFKTPKYSK